MTPLAQELQNALEKATYYTSAQDFFGLFPQVFSQTKRTVFKKENRQTYVEPGNPSYEAFAQGDWEMAINLIPQARQGDVEIYAQLARRGVGFTRCRPISMPISHYLRWEMEMYRFSHAHGEQIFIYDSPVKGEEILPPIDHDFMLFDESLALVHNYDAQGLIQGGWRLTEPGPIKSLHHHFRVALERSQPFFRFLDGL